MHLLLELSQCFSDAFILHSFEDLVSGPREKQTEPVIRITKEWRQGQSASLGQDSYIRMTSLLTVDLDRHVSIKVVSAQGV